MTRFSIYSGLVLVGYSALDYGDPPMGVASDQFELADGHAAAASLATALFAQTGCQSEDIDGCPCYVEREGQSRRGQQQ